MNVRVLVPPGSVVPGAPAFATPGQLIAALEGLDGPAVLLSDGLSEAETEAVAAAVTRASIPVIEVRLERWDGASFSSLSAACRGVISGFGLDGIAAARRLLENEPG